MALVNTGSRLGNLSGGDRNIGSRGEWWDNGGPLFAHTSLANCSKRSCPFKSVGSRKCYRRRVVCSRSQAGGPGYNRLTTNDATGTGHPDSPYVKKIGYYSPLLTDTYRTNYQLFDQSADIISLRSLVSTQDEIRGADERLGSVLPDLPVIGKLNLKLTTHETATGKLSPTVRSLETQQPTQEYVFEPKRDSVLHLFGIRVKHNQVIDNAIPLEALYFAVPSIEVQSSSISFSSNVIQTVGTRRTYRETYDISMDFIWRPYLTTKKVLNAFVHYNCLMAVGQVELKMASLPES